MCLAELSGIGRTFSTPAGPVHALHGITERIEAGAHVALVGPSGSGKSTLLGLIGGLDRPTTGQLTVLGQRLDQLSERERTAFRGRSVGLVFQDPHLLPGLSALENVMAARLPHHPPRSLRADALALLEELGLAHRAHFPPARLSGGERQRVGIARALIGAPALLLADEPTGNLDQDNTHALMSILERLREERGLTVIVATHDPLVAKYAGRTLTLGNGTIIEAT